MDACIFVLTINMMTPVYMSDRATYLTDLTAGDKVCVMEILPDEWMSIHWSAGGIGHTGFLHGATVHKEAKPTEPTPYEEHEALPPPQPIAPPTPSMPPQQQRGYPGQPMPSQEQRSASTPNLPRVLAMTCQPSDIGARSYDVFFKDGDPSLKITGSNVPRWYHVIDRHDNSGGHILYVAAKRQDQERTLYFAFDYSQTNGDASAIRVKAPNGYDAKDKCWMDWEQTSY